MKKYEVVAVQESDGKGRVVHKEFDDYDVARTYADEMAYDNRTVRCSIYKGENRFLVMDVL